MSDNPLSSPVASRHELFLPQGVVPGAWLHDTNASVIKLNPKTQRAGGDVDIEVTITNMGDNEATLDFQSTDTSISPALDPFSDANPAFVNSFAQDNSLSIKGRGMRNYKWTADRTKTYLRLSGAGSQLKVQLNTSHILEIL